MNIAEWVAQRSWLSWCPARGEGGHATRWFVVVFPILAAIAPVSTEGQCVVTEVSRLDPRESAWSYGGSVSVGGDSETLIAAVGASRDFFDGELHGSVRVFRFDSRTRQWPQEARLSAREVERDDRFGWSVGVSRDGSERRVLVGAIGRDDLGRDSGAAYLFRDVDGAWVEEQRILPSDGRAGDAFGHAVAMSGEVAVVTAYQIVGRGKAYVFRYHGSKWIQEAILRSEDGERFGNAVAVEGDTIVVAASFEHDDDGRSRAVYVYRVDQKIGGWLQEAKLLAKDGTGNDQFGASLSLHEGSLLVGAPGQWNENGRSAGAAYLFERDGVNWSQTAKLLPSDGGDGDFFGTAVALSADAALVSAPRDSIEWTESGSAYFFRKTDSGWTQEAKVHQSDGWPEDWFGESASMYGDTVVFAAPTADYRDGKAYVFNGFVADCNANGEADVVDICRGSAIDCQKNGVPDECDIADGHSEDQDQNGIPDECEGACCMPYGLCVDDFPRTDCPGFFTSEVLCEDVDPPCGIGACCALDWPCELLTRDECLARGCSREYDWQCDGDINGDGLVTLRDVVLVQHFYGSRFDLDLCNYDIDCDGQINAMDAEIVQSLIGTCGLPRDACFSGNWHAGEFCEDVECR